MEETPFVTFYSYRGGVGRTILAANVARLMAEEGKRVLLWDMDLEAPGLHFLQIADEDTGPTTIGRGFVDYVVAYCEKGAPPELDECYFRRAEVGDQGEVILFPAGRPDEEYPRKLASIHWSELYAKREGFELVEYVRGRLLQTLQPDYVLVDSRSGLSDLAVISLRQLPDIAVLCYRLSEAGVESVRFIRDLLLGEKAQEKRIRPLKLVYVAGPTPQDAPELAREARERSNRSGVNADVEIPFRKSVALTEKVWAKEHPDDELVGAYRRVCDRVVERLRDL